MFSNMKIIVLIFFVAVVVTLVYGIPVHDNLKSTSELTQTVLSPLLELEQESDPEQLRNKRTVVLLYGEGGRYRRGYGAYDGYGGDYGGYGGFGGGYYDDDYHHHHHHGHHHHHY